MSVLARAFLLGALALGACSPPLPPAADRVQFCTDELTYFCARDLAAGRTTMTQYNTCASQIDSRCVAFSFPPGCTVRQPAADACISAASDARRLTTLSADLPECQLAMLCPGVAIADAGADAP